MTNDERLWLWISGILLLAGILMMWYAFILAVSGFSPIEEMTDEEVVAFNRDYVNGNIGYLGGLMIDEYKSRWRPAGRMEVILERSNGDDTPLIALITTDLVTGKDIRKEIFRTQFAMGRNGRPTILSMIWVSSE